MISRLAIQDIPSTDCRFLRLVDNSFYNPDIAVDNALIEITPPGFDCPVVFNTQAYFNTAFNSSLLKIAPSNLMSQLVPLPEGVYKIKYSINPNSTLYVEYEYLRNCQQILRYAKALCTLLDAKCSLTKREFEEQRRQLIWIKELMDAAKYMVEERGESKAGLDLYNEASRLLDNINDCGC